MLTPSAIASGWRRGLTIALLAALLAWLYLSVFMAKAHLTIELQVSAPTRVRVFWAGADQRYSERRSVRLSVDPETTRHTLTLGDLGSMRRLRIDPSETPGQATIRRIAIEQFGYEPVRLESAAALSRLKALHQVQALTVGPQGLMLTATGEDPQLELELVAQRVPLSVQQWLPLLLLLAAWVLLLLFERHFGQQFRYIPYGLACALTLALVMAHLSRDNAHPDEHIHVMAARYYEDHWRAPQICAPEILDSYSPYGHSRLHNLEIVYLLAGKWSRLLRVFPGLSENLYLRLRLFNVALLALLLGISLYRPATRLMLLPLLLSAQVWYIFSYFNSDAFALVMITLGALQAIEPESQLRRLLRLAPGRPAPYAMAAIGLLLALLLLIKMNYYAIHLLMGLVLIAAAMGVPSGQRWQVLRRAAQLAMVTGLWLAPFLVAEVAANGLDRKVKLRACREQLASLSFKSATPLEQQHWTLNLRERGVSLKDVWVQNRWGDKVFRSGFGVYGYLSVSAPEVFYDTVRPLAALFLAYILIHGMLAGSAADRGWGAVLLLLAALSVGATLWHAWTRDFQAQGRYLLPLLTLAGVWLQRCGMELDRLTLNGLSLLLIALALYSFVCVALPGLVSC